MRTLQIALLLMILMSMFSGINAQNRPGQLYFSDGSVQEFLFIGYNTTSPAMSSDIRVWQGDISIEYNIWDFKRIEFIEPQRGGSLLTHTIDGEILKYDNYSTKEGGSFSVSFIILDNVTGQRKRITHKPGRTLTAVEFGTSTGEGGFMINPRTNSQFPIYYKFDPYTVEKLETQTVSNEK